MQSFDKQPNSPHQEVFSEVTADQLKTVYPNEKDGLFTTELIMDNRIGEIRLVKKFKHLEQYKYARKKYKNIYKDFADEQSQLEQFLMLPCEYDDNQRVIYFLPGNCSLQQLLDEPNFTITTGQAAQIFITLVESVIIMKEHGYSSLNLTPDNLYIFHCPQNQNQYILKLIDFEFLSKLEQSTCTPAFFNSPMRENNAQGIIVFKNTEEKFKNQIYSVIAIMQCILYKVRNQQSLLLHNQRDTMSKLAQLWQNIQQQVNTDPSDESSQKHLISEILAFITEKGLEEQYSFDELKTLILSLKQNLRRNYFYDSQSIIQQIEQKQVQKIKQLGSDPLALFVRLKMFINQMGSKTVFKEKQFDVINQLKQKLALKGLFNHKSILIIGESGSGKTLLLLKLIQELQQEITQDYNIVYINMADVTTIKISNREQGNSLLLSLVAKQLQFQNKKLPLLILFDNYDRLSFKKLKLASIIKKKYKAVNIIVTTHPDYVTEVELNYAFGQLDKIYLKPFNIDQQTVYISKLLQFFKENKNQASNYNFFETFQDYCEILNKNSSLEKYCKIPQTLYFTILVMPELQSELVKNKFHNFTKYQIYLTFIKNYSKNKIINITQEDKQNVITMYPQLDFEQRFLQDVKLFNQLCSWQMLSQQSFELSDNQIQNVLMQMQVFQCLQSTNVLYLIIKSSPSASINITSFSYIHKSFYEFYIAQSIIDESLDAKTQALDQQKTMLNTAFLRFDLDILTLVSEHVMDKPLELQYLLFFETWYRSVLLTRKIWTDIISDELAREKLEKIGSNCLNLLSGSARCDLTNRDFSDCSIPYAFLYKRDLSGSNFNYTKMDNSTITSARLNEASFIETSLKNLKYGLFPDFRGHDGDVLSLAFSPDGKYLATGGSQTSVRLWSVEGQKLINTLRGHRRQIYSVEISPDGKYLASGSGDQTIKLWNIQKQKIFATLQGHGDKVWAVSFSPNGKQLASGSLDGTVKLWSLEELKLINTLEVLYECVYSVAFASEGKYLAAGGGGKAIKVWSAQSWCEVATLEGHTNTVWSLAFSPDGKYLASGSREDTIKLWSLEFQKEVTTLQGHARQVQCVTFSPDGKYLASGSDDNMVKVWSMELQKEIATLKGHSNGISSIVFSPDGKQLASGCYDSAVKLWSFEWDKEVATVQGHSSWVTSVTFSPNSNYLASGSDDKTIKLWSVESQREVATLKGHTSQIRSVTFSPDGNCLASGSSDKTIRLWSIASQKEVTMLLGSSKQIKSIKFSPDGKLLASASGEKTIKIWSLESQKELAKLPGHSDQVLCVAFSPDSKYLASGGSDNTIRLWSVELQKEVRTIQGHTNDVSSIQFSSDGKYLASGSGDKMVKLWNLEEQKLINMLQGHNDYVSSVAFSPDGKYLASGSYDKTVKLWSVEEQRLINTLQGHRSWVFSVAFSSDGKYMASGSDDKTVKLWNFDFQKETNTLQGYRNQVQSVAFSLDGKYLASSSYDSTIKLWSLEEQKIIATLQSHGGYNTTQSMVFSPDSRYLASGGDDNLIKLWSVQSQKQVAKLQGHTKRINSLAFSPDGNYLASESDDKTVKLWNIESPKEIITLKGHSDKVRSIAFSLDGQQLASVSFDNTFKLWSLLKFQ